MYRSFVTVPLGAFRECWSAYWEALDYAVANASAVDGQHVSMTVFTRDELSIFEWMAFLRLVDVNTPASVSVV